MQMPIVSRTDAATSEKPGMQDVLVDPLRQMRFVSLDFGVSLVDASMEGVFHGILVKDMHVFVVMVSAQREQ